MTDKRKKRIRELAAKAGLGRRDAANQIKAKMNGVSTPTPEPYDAAKVHAEWDVIEASITESVLKAHIPVYFSSSEEKRLEALAEMEEAEREQRRIVSSPTLPVGEWNIKLWPAPARQAIIALWRTPRDNPHA